MNPRRSHSQGSRGGKSFKSIYWSLQSYRNLVLIRDHHITVRTYLGLPASLPFPDILSVYSKADYWKLVPASQLGEMINQLGSDLWRQSHAIYEENIKQFRENSRRREEWLTRDLNNNKYLY